MKFTNTIQEFSGKVIKIESFETLQEAKKSAKKLMKEYNIKKHGYNFVNYSELIELFKSY